MITEINTETAKMIQASTDPERTQKILESALTKMKAINSNPDETQIEVLTNHLIELLERSKRSETLDNIDTSVFTELSADSLVAAEQIIVEIGNLSPAEKYVLAVHFEVAK